MPYWLNYKDNSLATSTLGYLKTILCTHITCILELDQKKVLLVHSVFAKFPLKCQRSMIWKYFMDFQSLHLKNISDNHQVWQAGHSQI